MPVVPVKEPQHAPVFNTLFALTVLADQIHELQHAEHAQVAQIRRWVAALKHTKDMSRDPRRVRCPTRSRICARDTAPHAYAYACLLSLVIVLVQMRSKACNQGTWKPILSQCLPILAAAMHLSPVSCAKTVCSMRKCVRPASAPCAAVRSHLCLHTCHTSGSRHVTIFHWGSAWAL